ncbi:MAG TPA: zinc ribbon domain-containing protein [Armatimonadota bacterium]|nr:zinc ribbon domain-containing protein [Armatimonadota bacterium]
MFLIVGDQYNFEYIGAVPVACPECRRSPASLFLARKKLTLYYIPTFSLGANFVLRCRNCGKQWEVDREIGERLQAQATRDNPGSATQVKPGPSSRTPPATGGSSPAGSASVKCRKCSANVPIAARFCQECGEPVVARSSRVCPSCGSRQDSGRYCSRCGAELQA